jgi:hypothetical protein
MISKGKISLKLKRIIQMRIKKEAIILCELWLFFVAPPRLELESEV